MFDLSITLEAPVIHFELTFPHFYIGLDLVIMKKPLEHLYMGKMMATPHPLLFSINMNLSVVMDQPI